MATPKANVIRGLMTPRKSGMPSKTPNNGTRTFSFNQRPGVESDDSAELNQVFEELNG